MAKDCTRLLVKEKLKRVEITTLTEVEISPDCDTRLGYTCYRPTIGYSRINRFYYFCNIISLIDIVHVVYNSAR